MCSTCPCWPHKIQLHLYSFVCSPGSIRGTARALGGEPGESVYTWRHVVRRSCRTFRVSRTVISVAVCDMPTDRRQYRMMCYPPSLFGVTGVCFFVGCCLPLSLSVFSLPQTPSRQAPEAPEEGGWGVWFASACLSPCCPSFSQRWAVCLKLVGRPPTVPDTPALGPDTDAVLGVLSDFRLDGCSGKVL